MSELQREEMLYDVVIVGAGPAGLSTAIKLKQVNSDLSVCLLEKSAEVGAHILSGNVFETKALDELIPNWKELDAPIKTEVSSEDFLFLSKDKSFKVPNFLLPKALQNHGNYIISLSNLCKWLGEFAENLGVEIFPGFAASKLIYNEKERCLEFKQEIWVLTKMGTLKITLNLELILKEKLQFYLKDVVVI
tara:strand:- start:21 stop:593 length:573 start_codon:yes stop_codon:yes gene_type:complete